jgi:hypothetical protein
MKAIGIQPPAEGRLAHRPDERNARIVARYLETGSAYPVAEDEGVSVGTVYAVLDKEQVPRPRRPRPTREQEQARLDRLPQLIEARISDEAIKREIHCNTATLTALKTKLHIPLGRRLPLGRPRRYAEPDERDCKRCGDKFTPRYPSLAVNGLGVYCSKCGPSAIRVDIRNCELYCEEHGLWTTEQAAQWLLVHTTTVQYYLRKRLLKATPWTGEVLRYALLCPDEVKRFARARRRSTDHRVFTNRDDVWLLNWAAEREWTAKQAQELVERATLRRERYAKIRVSDEEPLEKHRRWACLFAELEAEQAERRGLLELSGERPPSRLTLAEQVGYRDVTAHPDEWPDHYVIWEEYAGERHATLNPSLADNAARTVWAAVKPLLSPVIS